VNSNILASNSLFHITSHSFGRSSLIKIIIKITIYQSLISFMLVVDVSMTHFNIQSFVVIWWIYIIQPVAYNPEYVFLLYCDALHHTAYTCRIP
jgi:hypothetical protein